MASDVAWMKGGSIWTRGGIWTRHMPVRKCSHACIRMCVCSSVRVYVCARVRACEERDKAYFKDNDISL